MGGLQEFHDEACLAVYNNKYGDGIKWHDVACHTRSVIVCEDSDQLINLIATQEGVDVRDEADEGTNAIDVDSLPSCQSCPPRLLHRQFRGNSSSSLSSLRLSLRHRPSSRANSALPRVSLQDLCGRCLSDLRLSALSRRGTPSPPYSPTSGCPSSKDHHLN